MPSVYLATFFVQNGCIQLPSCARICGPIPDNMSYSPGGLADSLGWKRISYRAVRAGYRQQVEVMCPLMFGGSWTSRCLQQLSFCSSLCCIIVGEVVYTPAWSEVCAGRQQFEVLCPHVLWHIQVFPDACRTLSFSALCCSFTDLSGRELREREK
jgi:hypothetical protein